MIKLIRPYELVGLFRPKCGRHWCHVAEAADETGQQVRISDVQVNNTSQFPSTVTYVQNTDSYGKQWWWFADIDAAGLSKALTTNNAQLISFRAYNTGGGNIRYIA